MLGRRPPPRESYLIIDITPSPWGVQRQDTSLELAVGSKLNSSGIKLSNKRVIVGETNFFRVGETISPSYSKFLQVPLSFSRFLQVKVGETNFSDLEQLGTWKNSRCATPAVSRRRYPGYLGFGWLFSTHALLSIGSLRPERRCRQYVVA